MNWEKLRDNQDQNIDLKTRLKSPENIEIAAQNLTNLIQSAACDLIYSFILLTKIDKLLKYKRFYDLI
ncbi:Hypothetical protein CINCED_3A021398, partial [Cinara cedri]